MAEGLACDVCRRFYDHDEVLTNPDLNIYTVEAKYDAKPNSVIVTVCSVDCLHRVQPGTLGPERWDFRTVRHEDPKRYRVVEILG